MKQPRGTPRSRILLALCVSSCARSSPPALFGEIPGHVHPRPPCAPEHALVLVGNLGRTTAIARIAATDSGYRGDLRMLGNADYFAVSGTRGARVPIGDDPEALVPVFECRFEVRGGDGLFGTLTGRCTEPRGEPELPSLSIDGSWSLPVSTQELPAFLSEPTFQGVPDPVYAALVREESGEVECAPFFDVREVRRLSRSTTAVLYERRVPCASGSDAAEASTYRFAIVEDGKRLRVRFGGPFRDLESYAGVPSLVAYQVAPQSHVFGLTFSRESHPRAARRFFESSSVLFGLTPAGRTGPLLKLPRFGSDGNGCEGPLDTTVPWFVELDGTPPAELVLEHEHLELPCGGGPSPASDGGDTTTFAAFRFDPEQARFDAVPLGSGALAVQQRRGWNQDVSEPADDWRSPPDELCSDGTNGR